MADTNKISQTVITIDTSGEDAKVKELLQFWRKKKKYLKRLMREPIAQAKKEVQRAAKGAMRTDPRQAHKAVRGYVWKRGDIGMSLSLMGNVKTQRKAPQPARKIKRFKSERSKMFDEQWGAARGFVLRVVNQGRGEIQAKMPSGKTARRGRIPATHFFAPAAGHAMDKAVEEVSRRISILIKEVAENPKK